MILGLLGIAGMLLFAAGLFIYHTTMAAIFLALALWYWVIYRLALWLLGADNGGWALLISAVLGTGLLINGVVQSWSARKNTKARATLDG